MYSATAYRFEYRQRYSYMASTYNRAILYQIVYSRTANTITVLRSMWDMWGPGGINLVKNIYIIKLCKALTASFTRINNIHFFGCAVTTFRLELYYEYMAYCGSGW